MKSVLYLVKKRWYVLVVLFVISGIFLYYKTQSEAQLKKTTTYLVHRQTLKEILSLSGQIDASEHVVLQFQTGGLLSWVGVKEGDEVKKYQGIAALDQRSVTKNLQTSLNTYAKYRNSYEQSLDDNKRIGDQPDNDIGDKMKRLLENAQYDLTNSVLAVELQDLARQYSYLASPIEGVVIRVDAPYAGVNVGVTTGYEIVNPKTIFFSATADQTDVVKLQNGMEGQITLDSYTEKKIGGKIYFISFIPKAGETGTIYEIKMAITPDNSNLAYRLGMTGDSEFIINEKQNVVTVNSSFVGTEGNEKYVIKMKGNTKVKTIIKTGLEVDGNYEILSGVEEGDTLISP